MSEHTNIAWADSTFNPWIGCTKVSPGCDGCYAEALMDKRMGRVKWGAGQERKRTSEAYWRQPLAWDRKARESGKPWRVFCGSLCDVFDNEAPIEWRRDLWDSIGAMTHLTWLLLTKRIGNAPDMLPGGWYGPPARNRGPWPNVWLGATVVNQEEADRDIPKLLAVPAAVRFLSLEPMLEPIDLTPWLRKSVSSIDYAQRVGYDAPHGAADRVDWVIVGGESDQPGHRARPFNIEWARDIVRQCNAAGVPCFVKQMGSTVIVPRADAIPFAMQGSWQADELGGAVGIAHPGDRAGADPSEWPADLRVREFPR